MLDQRTLSFINAHAIFGALSDLVLMDDQARQLVEGLKKPINMGVAVKDGPDMILSFKEGKCMTTKGRGAKGECDFYMATNTPERFNAIINGALPPLNLKLILNVNFLTKVFTPLTDILTRYLRATEEDLQDRHFYEVSTYLLFDVITEALCAIGNNDPIGKLSAKRIIDGEVAMEIEDGPKATIVIKDRHMEIEKRQSTNSKASMVFDSIDTARKLFMGEEDAMTFIGNGKLKLSGRFDMLDNVNRLLNRVALYLA